MIDLTTDIRELSFAEIDMVSGAGWFSDIMSAIRYVLGNVQEIAIDVMEWFMNDYCLCVPDENGTGVTITMK
jgi:hypothetical protein